MYVTKQFLINIHSKYTRPFHEQHKTELEGGAKKNPKLGSTLNILHLQRILICLLVVCNNQLKHIGFVYIHRGESLLIQINVSLVLK